MRNLLAAMLALAFVGCRSIIGEVVPVGRDTYTVNVEDDGQLLLWSDVKQLATTRANEHCVKMGRHITIEKWETRGARGWTRISGKLTFSCDRDESKKN